MEKVINSSFIKESVRWLGWVLLIIVLLSLKMCGGVAEKTTEGETVKVNIKVPEIRGEFKTEKPGHAPLTEKNVQYKTVYVNGKSVLVKDTTLLAANKKLKEDFKKLDSLSKIQAYDKAIQLNKFYQKFEDKNILLNVEGVVRGEIQELKPSYFIKPREIEAEVKIPQTKFRVLGGAEVGVGNQFAVKGSLGVQTKKGNIFTAAYDSRGNYYLGYSVPLFTYKK